MPPEFNENCVKCFKCVEVCPCDVLREGAEGPVVKYPEECWHCGACVMDCEADAIKIRLPVWMKPITRRMK